MLSNAVQVLRTLPNKYYFQFHFLLHKRTKLEILTDVCEWHFVKTYSKAFIFDVGFSKVYVGTSNFIHEYSDLYLEIPNINLEIFKIKVEFQRFNLKLPR